MGTVTELGVNNIEEIRQLLRVCWLDTYTGLVPSAALKSAMRARHSPENIARAMLNPKMFYAGYREGTKLIGTVSAGRISKDTVKVFQLYVLPSQQRKGIGSTLMSTAMSTSVAPRRSCWTSRRPMRRGSPSTASTGSAIRVRTWLGSRDTTSPASSAS